MVNDQVNSLFVSNQFPFPARDGVTVPFCNYAQLFKEHCGPVDLLVLNSGSERAQNNENQQIFRNVYELPIRPTSRVKRFGNQLMGRAPFFSGWRTAGQTPESLRGQTYGVVVSTPRSVMAVVDQLRYERVINANCHVAAVNDIASLAKKNLAGVAFKDGVSFKSLIHFSKLTMQRLGLPTSECRLLSNDCDLFIVQSDAETNWIRQHGSLALQDKVVQLSNGVDDHFFELPLSKPKRTCTFVGGVAGEYLQRVNWLVDKVWRPMQAEYPDARFTVSGKCSDASMIDAFARYNVVHRQFVEDPQDLYSQQSVLLAPIYKGFGLINKVVQSMAAGTIVIGDPTAFNAIAGFEAGKHGIVAASPEQFVKALSNIFANPEEYEGIRFNARQLIQSQFQWDSRYFALQKKLLTLSLGNN